MIEKSIGLVSDSGAGLYVDPSLEAMRAGAGRGSELPRPRMRALPDYGPRYRSLRRLPARQRRKFCFLIDNQLVNMYDGFGMTKRVKIPPSVAEQAMVRLMRVGDRLWRASDERFGRWGLTDNHYNVLRILNGAGEPISQAEIGRKMLSSRANVTKLLDALEERKFVRRLSCEDRRVNLVELTDEGAKFLEETAPDVIGSANEEMRLLTREEQKTLFNLLGKLLGE
jgi:MarR family transcriptional regulator, 2-MHQ and catechol-resistance regulon repressor